MMRGLSVTVAFIAFLVLPPVAYGQADEARRPFVWDVTRAVLIDPTTYVPAAVSYEAMLQDWKTSQVLFARGWVEANPRFTVSGRPNDVPVSYGAGKRRIGLVALDVLRYSAGHNMAVGVAERIFIGRYPAQKKLIRTISWIERIGYASFITYRNSAEHFRQAGANRRLAREHYGR
jgi:hypothetical protein